MRTMSMLRSLVQSSASHHSCSTDFGASSAQRSRCGDQGTFGTLSACQSRKEAMHSSMVLWSSHFGLKTEGRLVVTLGLQGCDMCAAWRRLETAECVSNISQDPFQADLCLPRRVARELSITRRKRKRTRGSNTWPQRECRMQTVSA